MTNRPSVPYLPPWASSFKSRHLRRAHKGAHLRLRTTRTCHLQPLTCHSVSVELPLARNCLETFVSCPNSTDKYLHSLLCHNTLSDWKKYNNYSVIYDWPCIPFTTLHLHCAFEHAISHHIQSSNQNHILLYIIQKTERRSNCAVMEYIIWLHW